MQISNSGPPPTRPLDVLFYIGLGLIAVLLISFTVYMSMKILVMQGGLGGLRTRFGRRRATPSGLAIHDGEEDAARVPTPVFPTRYLPYLDPPDFEGQLSPGRKHQGLGIDFGEGSPVSELGKDYGGNEPTGNYPARSSIELERYKETSNLSSNDASSMNSPSYSTIGVAR
ncbi:hypothetical protein PsYK624_142500 [Phanerochaete sordida]|uniref:Uncharacterized protein n=1 Tax=Phanerochaete sordida TaxID=48140 RepID=A0A9P3GLI0_9APHY|nr:hypothetical protein PsYK624_142500 [Phanerochaete sordida]